ncbi:hypothetical protein ACTFIY_009108 [Dictyostelium cf. discoideum]
MSTKECYFCDQIVELFEFHRHSLKCIIKASHKYSVDIETVINETLIEVNVDYKLLKQRINKKQKSDHLFENDFSPSPSPSLNSQRMDITPSSELVNYPIYLSSTNCIIYHYILISNTTQKENIDQLVPSSELISSGGDSVIYGHSELLNIGETKNIIFTINDNNQTNGFLNISYICKDVDVSLVTIEIIQEVTWSDNLKYSSIVRLNGIPDESAIPGCDNAIINRLGNSKYRIIYKESYYTKLLSPNSNRWYVVLKISSYQILNVSVPFTPIWKDEYPFNEVFTGAVLFRSNSTIQRPIYTVFAATETPKPIYGEKGNITYYLNIIPNFPPNQTYSLLSQNDDGSFEIIPNKTVEYIMGNTNYLGAGSVYIDNTTIESTLYFTVNFTGVQPYDFRTIDCDFKNANDDGFVYSFHFGFINGNNKNNIMSISIPMSTLSVIENCILSCNTQRNQIQNPHYNPDFVLNAIYGKIAPYKKINIYGFTFLVVFNAQDDYGINYFTSTVIYKNYRIGSESLVSGKIKDGIWEFLHDGVNVGSDYTGNGFNLLNQIDKNTYYRPNFPFSNTNPYQTILLPEIKLNDTVNYYKDIKDISFLFNNVHVTNQSVDNTMYFMFDNIENYKNLAIGFTLTDPKSLKDNY